MLSWIFIHQVRYVWKACLFAFRLMPYFLGLFHWGVCRVRKLGGTSKRKGCKIDWIEWEMCVISRFWLSFVSVRTTHYHYAHYPFISQQSSCIQSQKESPKFDIYIARISHSILSILQPFFFMSPQFTQPARDPVKQP